MASSDQTAHEQMVSTFTVALAHLNRVEGYLRNGGESEAANLIAKNVNDIVVLFAEAATNIGAEKQGPKVDFAENTPQPNVTAAGKGKQGSESTLNGSSKSNVSRGKRKDVSFASDTTIATVGTSPSSVGTGSIIRNPQSRLTSWARVAAMPPIPDNVLVKPKPVVLKSHNASTQKSITYPAESLSEQLRVVWVLGCTKNTETMFITNQIHEGPLLSVAFAEENEAYCLVFQFGGAAASFLETNGLMMNTRGISCYGPGYELMVGAPFPMCDELKAMDYPARERRRLTFVKAGLFQDVTPYQWEQEIVKLVGYGNIERVWVFNSGNGTAVFASTSVARMVKESFDYRSKIPGPYQGLNCTYSSDPCEKPVNWTTQYRDCTYGGRNNMQMRNFGIDGSSSPPSRSPGWQRVKPRRR